MNGEADLVSRTKDSQNNDWRHLCRLCYDRHTISSLTKDYNISACAFQCNSGEKKSTQIHFNSIIKLFVGSIEIKC